ncbi:winged helix-turn-helix domain-containing protein [Streptomyces sp. NPDC058770]|uniref:helix-turn-helix domain-containing protein n=1 Tax=Streptomyces sp. NPDC058770 TaxID=3346631 RepID=UPI00367B089B
MPGRTAGADARHGPPGTEPARSAGELALGTGVSIGTASKHASVLRRAGLLASTRRGCMVLHALTPLGRALVRRR